MATSVTIASTPLLRSEYQRLLLSDWRKDTLDEVFELLWKEIASSKKLLAAPLREVLEPPRRRLELRWIDADVIKEIQQFRRHFRGTELVPPFPEHFPARRGSRRRSAAETAWTYLVLGNLVQLQGDTGFFADTQSLLFLLAVDYLLPQLEKAGEIEERDCLLNALYMHTFIAWTDDPQRQAHHFFLQAVLMDQLGQPRFRQENLHYALNLTHLEDHSFLTKVQAYVFGLLDASQDEEAKHFLMRLYRRAPETYLAELQEMLDQVQEASTARSKRKILR